MCHEDDAIMHKVAIMHEPQASALCNQVHYASSECATLKDSSSAGRVITVLLLVMAPCPFTGAKSAITTYRTLKCALSDLMHCFRSIWLVRCHVTSNNIAYDPLRRVYQLACITLAQKGKLSFF